MSQLFSGKDNSYLRFRIIRFLKIGFSPKASGFYPFGDATDLVRGRR